MKKIYIILGILLILSSCEDFLGVNPDKSGNAEIYHMDQLVGLMGDAERIYNDNYDNCIWQELIYMSDDTDFTPYIYDKINYGSAYWTSVWDQDHLENGRYIEYNSWNACYRNMFTFNVVLENLDKVIQTTMQAKEQARGEALFGRAYFHFHALVLYCRYELDAPGMGYRDNTAPDGIPERKTVEYTIGRIEKDLAEAEAALTKAGRTEFEIKRNFRITTPTLNAFRARFELYRGNYEKALVAANIALGEHSTLLDFKNDPLYEIMNPLNYDLLDESGNVVGNLPYYELSNLHMRWSDAAIEFEELYIPQFSDVNFGAYIPLSKSYYDIFNDKDNDERWKRFHDNNWIVARSPAFNAGGFKYEDQQNLPEWNRHSFRRFANFSAGKLYLLGPTTGEMYLIKAECLARAGNQGEAQLALQTLRRARFTTIAAADNITGTVQDVLDERRRELTSIFRWYDLKRLNGKENANISITKKRHTNLEDKASAIIEDTLLPNDPRYALPIPKNELLRMGWEQN